MGMGMQCWNGNDSMGVGKKWEQESHSHTPLNTESKTSSKKHTAKAYLHHGESGPGLQSISGVQIQIPDVDDFQI